MLLQSSRVIAISLCTTVLFVSSWDFLRFPALLTHRPAAPSYKYFPADTSKYLTTVRSRRRVFTLPQSHSHNMLDGISNTGLNIPIHPDDKNFPTALEKPFMLEDIENSIDSGEFSLQKIDFSSNLTYGKETNAENKKIFKNPVEHNSQGQGLPIGQGPPIGHIQGPPVGHVSPIQMGLGPQLPPVGQLPAVQIGQGPPVVQLPPIQIGQGSPVGQLPSIQIGQNPPAGQSPLRETPVLPPLHIPPLPPPPMPNEDVALVPVLPVYYFLDDILPPPPTHAPFYNSSDDNSTDDTPTTTLAPFTMADVKVPAPFLRIEYMISFTFLGLMYGLGFFVLFQSLCVPVAKLAVVLGYVYLLKKGLVEPVTLQQALEQLPPT